MRTCTFHNRHQVTCCTECGLPTDLCLCENVEEMAMARIATPTGQSLRLIQRFVNESRDTHQDSVHLFSELVREVGELSARLSQVNYESEVSAQEVYKTCLNVAVLAVRISTEGDRDFEYDPIAIFGENSDTL